MERGGGSFDLSARSRSETGSKLNNVKSRCGNYPCYRTTALCVPVDTVSGWPKSRTRSGDGKVGGPREGPGTTGWRGEGSGMVTRIEIIISPL
ncbi:hypothetical protein RRG08_002197 [Elysia crispata]|uniref:Uncharacterized protein n=1 Tax=Elysia crispata TaxID=231223 RepID=A0AAE0ZAU1_9GAST|nr:hypothetical protein RRG08_002197 [Elysia crispata]